MSGRSGGSPRWDQFDGQVWTSRADYAESPSQLPSLFQSGTSVEQSFQEYRIEQLAAVWLPAAFEPRSLDSATTDIKLRANVVHPHRGALVGQL